MMEFLKLAGDLVCSHLESARGDELVVFLFLHYSRLINIVIFLLLPYSRLYQYRNFLKPLEFTSAIVTRCVAETRIVSALHFLFGLRV